MSEKRTYNKPFGFIISIKWTIQNELSGYTSKGETVYYRPKSSGYTTDFKQAGLYEESYARKIIARTSGEIAFVPISYLEEELLELNTNEIEEKEESYK